MAAPLLFVGCASTPTALPDVQLAAVPERALKLDIASAPNRLKAGAISAPIAVRAASRQHPHLLAIKDPITLAVEARVEGDYEKAYQHFYAAWLATPESQDVVISLANMALRIGKFEEAYALTSALDGTSMHPALIAAHVLAEIGTNKSHDPEGRLRDALKAAPHDYRLWNALGRYFDGQGQPDRAQASYQTALKEGGAAAGVFNNLGMSFLLQGKQADALSQFEQAALIDPKTLLYDNNRRLTLALMGDYRRAVAGLDGNRAADIFNDAGYIAKSRQNVENAAALFEAAIAQSTSYHSRAHANLKALRKLP